MSLKVVDSQDAPVSPLAAPKPGPDLTERVFALEMRIDQLAGAVADMKGSVRLLERLALAVAGGAGSAQLLSFLLGGS